MTSSLAKSNQGGNHGEDKCKAASRKKESANRQDDALAEEELKKPNFSKTDIDLLVTHKFKLGLSKGADVSELRQMRWVIENLGISRETIKYFDQQGLISPHRNPSANNRRVFDDDDLEQLWTVKLLREIGFSSKEILAMQRGETDFISSVASKVEQLDLEIENKRIALTFAKTIKFTGQVPALRNIGDMTFQDFIEYSRNNWNFAEDENLPVIQDSLEMFDSLNDGNIECMSEESLDRIARFFEKFGPMDEMAIQGIRVDTLTNVLLSMRGIDPSSDAVQIVVSEIISAIKTNLPVEATEEQIARTMTWSWGDCDIGYRNRRRYGEEACDYVLACLESFAARHRE